MSGRPDNYREATEKWLADNHIVYEHLYMRAAGDNREDSIVKCELFHKYVQPAYNISVVLDDRNRVVAMWRKLGLTVLQVAEGGF